MRFNVPSKVNNCFELNSKKTHLTDSYVTVFEIRKEVPDHSTLMRK